MILKEDRSLNALFSRLWEKFKVFWTPMESGYLMEPIGVSDDLRRGVRNVQNGLNALGPVIMLILIQGLKDL